ncbi:glycosyltransferase [Modestobacter sp. SYSU DS0290]
MTAPATGRPADGGLLGVVVVNYASAALIRRNLGAAGPLGPHVRVVVVDNASTVAERDAVRELTGELGWTLVELPGNRGFGVGSNAGIARARELGCTTFCCLNPDAVVSPEVLDQLRRASLADPLAMIAPRITDSTGRTVFAGSLLSLASGRIRSPQSGTPLRGPVQEWLTGACFVLHAELVDRTGGFADDYFLYWEDVELSTRVLAVGGRLVVREDLVAVHDEGGTQGERSGTAKSDLYYRYNCRNRLVFAARNLPRRRVLAWVLRTPAESWDILLRGGRRQLVESPGPLLAAVRGSLAGLLIALRALVTGPAGGRRPTPGPAPVLVAHPGAELYGSDRVLLESVGALARTRPVTVVVPGPGPLVTELEARGAQVVCCPMPVLRRSALRPAGLLRLVADTVRSLPRALRLVRRHGRGGVYVNTVTIPSWTVLGRLARRPVLVHVHEAERSTPRAVRTAMALPLRLARTVVVNSTTTRDVLGEVQPGLLDRTVVVRNAVAGPPVLVPPRAELTGPLQLLYVGRLSPRKGPHVAVAALAALRDRGVEAHLTLVGAVFAGYEWYERELRESVDALGLTGQVRFLGFHRDIWAMTADADVVLVPSQTDESFGNTAVEGVLAARPVVVSSIDGLREATTGYGCVTVVEPAAVDAWADALESVAARWSQLRAVATADAGTARARHAPGRYGAEVVAAVAALSARR